MTIFEIKQSLVLFSIQTSTKRGARGPVNFQGAIQFFDPILSSRSSYGGQVFLEGES